jgi:hypothetical protein
MPQSHKRKPARLERQVGSLGIDIQDGERGGFWLWQWFSFWISQLFRAWFS